MALSEEVRAKLVFGETTWYILIYLMSIWLSLGLCLCPTVDIKFLRDADLHSYI